ncbi:MAG: hypothetical protein Tsb0017_06320 [Geothermobacteraceae bacterium]
MYEAFFGLNCKPFELVPNPEFLYPSRTHRKAINYLQYGILENSGFVLLTGEVGAGKTTLIRRILDQLDEDVLTARVFNTRVDAVQVLRMVVEDFGLDVENKDKTELLRDLNAFLIEQCARRRKPVVIIDEAQNLSSDSLEEIRLLSNLEAQDRKLLQIILVGQPELKRVLAAPCLRQLRQRINISCHLGTLSLAETEEYFWHRLEKAGNREALTLPEGAFERIHACTKGVPRLINILGDYLLLAGFAEKTQIIDGDLLEEVIEELKQGIAFSASSSEMDDFAEESLQERLRRIEMRVGGPGLAENGGGSHEERLEKHEKVLKKLISTHFGKLQLLEEANNRIDRRLETVERKLDALIELLDGPTENQPGKIRALVSRLGS